MKTLLARISQLESESQQMGRELNYARNLAQRAEIKARDLSALGTRQASADGSLNNEDDSTEFDETSPEEADGFAHDDGYDFVAQERYFEDYFGELEQLREAEHADPEWDRLVRKKTEAVLSGQALVGNSLEELECGASLCRVTVNHDNEEARSQFSMLFIGGLGGEVQDATFHGPRGAEKTTVYMARRGHSLPPPTRRPGG
jgi:hypothetical protein